MGLGLVAATLERIVLSVIVLAVPTIAMGGTLPAAARAVTHSRDLRRQDLATLYALNTLGAVAGCVLATFVLLEVYGTRATLWLAAAINILIAVIARVIERRAVDERATDNDGARGFPPSRNASADRRSLGGGGQPGGASPAADRSPARLALQRTDLPAHPDLPELPAFFLLASGT